MQPFCVTRGKMRHLSNQAGLAQRPWIIAVAIAAAVALWLLSGRFEGTAGDQAHASEAAAAAVDDEALMEVQVRQSTAQTIPVEKEIRGRTTPWSEVQLAAETEGRVISVFHDLGEPVAIGEPILQIDPRAREQTLSQARAVRAQREAEYSAAQRLFTSKHISDTQLAQARAALEASRADEKRAQLDLDSTFVRSPIAGFIEARHVDVGDYLKVGTVAARVADISRLKLVAYVSEQDIRALQVGQQVTLSAQDSTTRRTGRMHFVARTSDAATRTYQVEVAIPNPDALPAGESLRGRIQVGEATAHKLSIGLLDLGDDGSLGILALRDQEDVVARYRVEILRTEADQAWFGGLPTDLRIITRGQGFVLPGETVAVQPVGS